MGEFEWASKTRAASGGLNAIALLLVASGGSTNAACYAWLLASVSLILWAFLRSPGRISGLHDAARAAAPYALAIAAGAVVWLNDAVSTARAAGLH